MIKSITPVDNWYAGYCDSESFSFVPIVFWAIVVDDETHQESVQGFVGLDYLAPAHDEDRFYGYFREDQLALERDRWHDIGQHEVSER